MTPKEFYEKQRLSGLTYYITSNEYPDYNLPFYQQIFDLMTEYAKFKTKNRTCQNNNVIYDNSLCLGKNDINCNGCEWYKPNER